MLKGGVNSATAQFDALRLVWHDYPGEWFEQDVSGPEEHQRRVDAFRSLLGSDVALLLVDGQRLLDNAGEEERYLRALLTNFRNGLLLVKDDLLVAGKPFVRFPRIWMLALSKSDLLPDLDVSKFKELLIENVGDDIDDLRKVLSGFVESSGALSVGEDFVLLSSAEFEVGKIDLTKRVGVELILPIAAMLPFERHVRWAQAGLVSAKVAETLLHNVGLLVAVLMKIKIKVPGPLGNLLGLINSAVTKEILDAATKLLAKNLTKIRDDALAKNDYLTATLADFRMALDKGEKEKILLKSDQ